MITLEMDMLDRQSDTREISWRTSINHDILVFNLYILSVKAGLLPDGGPVSYSLPSSPRQGVRLAPGLWDSGAASHTSDKMDIGHGVAFFNFQHQ